MPWTLERAVMRGGRYLSAVIAIVVAIPGVLLVYALLYPGGDRFDRNISFATLTGIPLFAIAILEIWRTLRLQRAAFVKDYIAKFFTDNELNLAFYELIYTYDNATYETVKQARMATPNPVVRPAYAHLQSVQRHRTEQAANRIYDPELFQLSQEERRLDNVLGFFDVIGYYYCKKFIRMEDIAGSMSSQLSVISRRDVITDYLRYCKREMDQWRKDNKNTAYAPTPFIYLTTMLDDFKEHNRRLSREFLRIERKFT